eukprot:1444768-Rhodomonas_salina.1
MEDIMVALHAAKASANAGSSASVSTTKAAELRTGRLDLAQAMACTQPRQVAPPASAQGKAPAQGARGGRGGKAAPVAATAAAAAPAPVRAAQQAAAPPVAGGRPAASAPQRLDGVAAAAGGVAPRQGANKTTTNAMAESAAAMAAAIASASAPKVRSDFDIEMGHHDMALREKITADSHALEMLRVELAVTNAELERNNMHNMNLRMQEELEAAQEARQERAMECARLDAEIERMRRVEEDGQSENKQ